MLKTCANHPPGPGRIALTGGIATGKSTVARLFAELGACILDADAAAREAVVVGTPCWRKLRELLGPDYFEASGALKRRKLRERIIGDHQCRSMVNALLHPFILRELDRQCRLWQEVHPEAVMIFDIPLLFEADLAEHFPTIILAYTPREIQLQRLMARDGLSREEAEATLAMQLPIDAKRSRSHIIIDNGFDLEHTRRQVRLVWEKLRRQGSRKISM